MKAALYWIWFLLLSSLFLQTILDHQLLSLTSFASIFPRSEAAEPLCSHISTMSKTFTQGEVSSKNKADALWIVVDGDVYDLTKFQDDHPGMW